MWQAIFLPLYWRNFVTVHQKGWQGPCDSTKFDSIRAALEPATRCVTLTNPNEREMLLIYESLASIVCNYVATPLMPFSSLPPCVFDRTTRRGKKDRVERGTSDSTGYFRLRFASLFFKGKRERGRKRERESERVGTREYASWETVWWLTSCETMKSNVFLRFHFSRGK